MPVDPQDVQQSLKDADAWYEAFYKWMLDHNVPGYTAADLASKHAHNIISLPTLVGGGVAEIIKLLAPFAAGVLKAFSEAKQDTKGALNDVIGGALEEFLGVKVDVSHAATGEGVEAGKQRSHEIGQAVHRLLLDEFGGLRPIDPKDGEANARTFTGFAINFAVTNSFIGLLGELLSLGQIDQFRELGVEVAQSMGLGRLQRLALQPLIRNFVQQPYDLYLKGQLRPDRLSEAQYVKAFQKGKLSEADCRQALAEKGYPDELITLLIEDLQTKITASVLERLVRYGVITDQQALEELAKDGTDQERAKWILQGADEGRADSQVSGILSDLERDRLKGFLDQGQFSALLDELPLSTEEERLFRKKVADQLERPRDTITWGQLKAGFVAGIVDLDYVSRWMDGRGYSDEDQNILFYELLLALEAAEAKTKVKQAAAAKATAKGKTPPAPLNPATP